MRKPHRLSQLFSRVGERIQPAHRGAAGGWGGNERYERERDHGENAGKTGGDESWEMGTAHAWGRAGKRRAQLLR
jgi:hypothetical protein